METSTYSETTQQETTNFIWLLLHVQLCPPVFKAATMTKTDCKLEGSWGIVLMLKSLQKQLQRRHRQWCLKMSTLIRRLMFFFRTVILSLLPSTGNNVQVSFLLHWVPHTSTSLRVLWYRQVFTQLSLHIGASNFTCRLMIANLLYMVVYNKTESIACQEM